MPSQVVAVIRRLFPELIRAPAVPIFAGHLNTMIAIVDLVKQIPQDLITVSVDDYAELICATTLIEEMNKFRVARGDNFSIAPVATSPGTAGRNAAAVIYGILSKCPDEYPPTTTTDLAFIPDPQLRESIRGDIGAVNRALSHAEWKAANVLAGSAIEALLHWKLSQPSLTSAQIAAAVQARVGRREMVNPRSLDLDTWTLEHFIGVAHEFGYIKDNTLSEAKLAQNYRNLIHPGRVARLDETCDRGTAFSAVAALEHVVRDLS